MIVLDELSKKLGHESVVPGESAHDDEDMLEQYLLVLLEEVGVQG